MRTTLSVLMWLVTATFASAQTQLPVVQHYVEGTQARDARDYAGYLASFVAASMEVPGHPILIIHTARAQALLGRSNDAIATLGRFAATGAWVDLDADTSLTALYDLEAFAEVKRQIEANGQPAGSANVKIEGGNPLLIPEGIAYDPKSGAFFLSSIADRKIVRVDRDGNFTDFTTRRDDFYGGLGMQIDPHRRHLWIVTSMWEGVGGYTKESQGFSAISCFDLDSGERLRHIDFADANDPHTFNDCALEESGSLYVTDTTTGALYLLAGDADTLQTIVPDGLLMGGNGLALDASKRLLYVSRWTIDVVVVDLATREVSGLMQPDDVALVGVDGLYLHDSGLIAVQNHPTMNRIARFRLSEDGRRVTGCDVLAGRLPNFDEPTTGVVVGDTFYFIGNSQIERFGDGRHKDPKDFSPTQILEISL